VSLAALSLTGVVVAAGPASSAAVAAAPSLSCPSTPYGVTESLATYGSPANGQALDLDEYLPGGDPQAKVPGVILVHGGGWATGNFTKQAGDSLTTIGDCLAENGFDAFSVDYALSVGGNGSFPENLQDINEAIGWVKAHVSNLNTAQMFILGTSAGGNLADLAGENAMGYQNGLLGVITQSGPADLTAAGMGCASAASCKAGSPGATIQKYLGCYDNSSATCNLQPGRLEADRASGDRLRRRLTHRVAERDRPGTALPGRQQQRRSDSTGPGHGPDPAAQRPVHRDQGGYLGSACRAPG